MPDTLCPKCEIVLVNSKCSQCGYQPKLKMGRIEKVAIYTVVAFMVGGVFIKVYKNLSLEVNALSTTYSESNAKWSRHELSDIGVSIESPGELKSKVADIPPETRQDVGQFKFYQYEGGVLSIGVTYIKYADGLIAIPVEAAEEAVENLINLEGVGDLQYKIIPEDQGKVSVRGSFMRKGQVLDIYELYVGQGQKMWRILVYNNRDNTEALTAANRIIRSIKFN